MKSVCVYCGSSPGNRPEYAEAARALGKALVENDMSLVYGGGKVGLMGIVADAVLEHGGSAIGIIPDALMQKEVGHRGLTELHVVRNMHERKQMMADRADAFIAMPGGVGTFEELFETFTWLQLGYHAKPVGLLNVAGFYDGMLGFLSHAVQEGFLKQVHATCCTWPARRPHCWRNWPTRRAYASTSGRNTATRPEPGSRGRPWRSERRARLLEEGQFLRRALPAQDSVPVRKAPEARDDRAVLLRPLHHVDLALGFIAQLRCQPD